MKKSGFTLIEVLIVIVVIAILAAIILPRILWGPKERENTLKANLAEIRAAVDLYQKQHGAYPTSLDVLTREKNDTTSKPYMDELPLDPITGKTDYNYDSTTGKVHSKARIGTTTTGGAYKDL